MKIFVLFLLVSLLVKPSGGIDKEEAQKAYTFLNSIRKSPPAYAAQMPFLKQQATRPLLIWNDTLAAVAEAKALDMATRQYFGHVNPEGYGVNYYINKAGYKLQPQWIEKKEMNYFESISAGAASGESAIENLLIDANTPGLGHRTHLLGLDEWNGSLKDIGIGYARPVANAPYQSYVCVIIAKHDW